jgi:hypothetical protein
MMRPFLWMRQKAGLPTSGAGATKKGRIARPSCFGGTAKKV